MLPVAILAGGLSTRLRPLTEMIPKALLNIAGKPFVHRQLDRLKEQGLRRIVLCVGYRGEQIQSCVGDGAKMGLEVMYSYDGPQLLGTGGALKKALPLLGEKFFVLYGDSYLPVCFADVKKAFEKSGRVALMSVFKNQNQWERSNVLFSGGLVRKYDKKTPSPDMAHIDYGLGVLTAAALEDVPGDRAFDLGDLYKRLSARGALAGYEVFERFYEIGSQKGLQETIHYFERGGNP